MGEFEGGDEARLLVQTAEVTDKVYNCILFLNLGYFPDSQWTDKVTAVVAEDGWIGFTFKYRDETLSFDLTKPLSDYITIDAPHSHTYENGICVGCGEAQPGPVITQQPTDCEAKLGERYMVEVLAEGEGLKYQWYFRNKGATRWTMSSVRDNTYDDVMNRTRANREVYCVITDAFGNQITTEVITLELSK